MANLLKQYSRKKRKEEAEKEIENIVFQNIAKHEREYSLAVSIIVSYTLHKTFGFGQTRLKRFFENSNYLQTAMQKRYEDSDLFAMEYKLRQAGIDVRKMFEDSESKNEGGTTI